MTIFVCLTQVLQLSSCGSHGLSSYIWTVLPKSKASKPSQLHISIIWTLRKDLIVHISWSSSITGSHRFLHNNLVQVNSPSIYLIHWNLFKTSHRSVEKLLTTVKTRLSQVEILHIVKINSLVDVLVQLCVTEVPVVFRSEISCWRRMSHYVIWNQGSQMVVELQ